MIKNYTFTMTLDPASSAVIDRLEAEIAAIHGQHRLYGGDLVPHITFGMFETVDLALAGEIIDEFAERFPPIPITFASLGLFVFETDVVFGTPIVTKDLLECHSWLHDRLATATAGPFEPLLPGSWVPHATLASDAPRDLLPAIIATARTFPLPMDATLERLRVARFPVGPVFHARQLCGREVASGER
jgi:2'-5' RNA ligase